MQRVQGFAEQGDTRVFTAGHASSNVVQGSFPFATVTVYLTGTTTLATIYADNRTPPTPLANPFTADSNGHWFFYAPNGRYDVRLSGRGLCPWTIGDIQALDGGAIDGGGTINSWDYDFAQSPGGTIVPGANQITLNPMPRGLAVGSYLCIHDPSGTMEAVQITGIGDDYVIISATLPHSGNWTIQSATGGIQEAINANNSGVIAVRPGTTNLCSNIVLKSNMTLQGAGIGVTILRIGNHLWPASNSGGFGSAAATIVMAVLTVTGASNVGMRDFTLDANGYNQTYTTYGCILGVLNASYCTIERVSIINPGNAGISIGGLVIGGVPARSLRIVNCQVHGMGGPLGSHTGGIFTQIPYSFIGWNYLDNLPDEYLIANMISNCTFVGNFCLGYPGNQTAACHQESASQTQWIGNTVKGGFGMAFVASPSSLSSMSATDFTMVGNSVVPDGGDGSVTGVYLFPEDIYTITDVLIIGNTIAGTFPVSPVSAGFGIHMSSAWPNPTPLMPNKKYVVQGNVIKGWVNGIYCGDAENVVIADNTIENNSAYGVVAQACKNTSITNNMLLNNAGGPMITAASLGVVATPNITDNPNTSMAEHVPLQVTLGNGVNQNVNIEWAYGVLADDMYIQIVGPTGAFSIGGMNGARAGKRVVLINFTTQPMTLNHLDPGSTASNQIYTPSNASVTAQVAEVIHDVDGDIWRLISVL